MDISIDMKISVTITANGQITIPTRYARKYGIVKGSLVSLEVVGEELVFRPAQVEAVRFDRDVKRFSVRIHHLATGVLLSEHGHLTATRVATLTGTPGVVALARAHPNKWVTVPR
jgi:AbrB family looped-hinge helix DNA binding protein